MAYDIETMVDIIGLYFNNIPGMGNPSPYEFTVYERTQMLNRAQKKVCSLIHPDMLSALETSDTNKALTAGTYAISSLTAVPLLIPMGITGVKITGGVFCDKISFETYKQLVKEGNTWAADEPAYYIYAETITVLPASATNGDFYYLKEPVDMDYNNGVDCALSDEIQEIIIDLATSIGYQFMRNDERAQTAFNKAILFIEAINSRIDPDYSRLSYNIRAAYMDWNMQSQIKEKEFDRKI